MRIVIFMSIFLSGCSAGKLVCVDYSWGKICKSDKNTVNSICAATPGLWDDGTYREQWASVNGCAFIAEKKIVLVDSCTGAEALPHELAHLDKHDDPKKDGYDWNDWGNE